MSCTPPDPATQLESLKAEKAAIEDKIVELEASMGDSLVATAPRAKYVRAQELTLKPFNHFIEVQGTVDTDQNVILTAQSGGTIETIHVNEGDEVKKGQVLISLDAKVLLNSIGEVKTQLTFARDIYEKQKALWEQKIGSEVQYLTAKNNKESLEARLATLREQLSMMRVTSPIDGVVDNMMAKAGELTSPGMPLGRVVNLSGFEIKAEVAENYSSRVMAGTKVKLWFPDLREELDAEVAYTGRVIDPVNRTFSIVIRMENPGTQIKPNMVCVVKIIDFATDEAIVIPVSTILRTDLGQYVFTAEKNGENYIARRKKITPRMEYNGNVMVAEGLKPSDWLVTFGYQDLTDGDIVKF